MTHSARGSEWHRWDLHFHTPSSYDYADGSVTNQDLVDCLLAAEVRVVAVTDHHVMDVERIREMQRLGKDRLCVLPGIELRGDHGGEPIHYICIFPEDCDLADLWTAVQGKLDLRQSDIAAKGGDDRIYVPIEKAAEVVRPLGGVISIHAGKKSNSIESIRNTEHFQQQIKYDITKNYVDIMEVGQTGDIETHLHKIFPATGLDKPLIVCSDNHNARKYSTKATLWLHADPTFRGLCMVLREPSGRICIGREPPQLLRIRQSPTKYVSGIKFRRLPTAPIEEKWFEGSVEFNPGLVAIIGNKGSGKSALADMISLAGATRNSECFSFLSRSRFRHPKNNLAKHYEVDLLWSSGDVSSRNLGDDADPDVSERIKYLPQDYVESVCNEILGVDGDRFSAELRAVIFSHVPAEHRLGHGTLDDLVRFETDEKQRRIDALTKQLKEANRTRATLEEEADPATRRSLEASIRQREQELAAIDAAKPEEVPNPSTVHGIGDQRDPETLKELSAAEAAKADIESAIRDKESALQAAERRRAVAARLAERLGNFDKEFAVFLKSLEEDAVELDLRVDDLAVLKLDHAVPTGIRDEASKTAIAASETLAAPPPHGLRVRLQQAEARVAEARAKLDAPQRVYRSYLKALADWEAKRAAIEGSPTDRETLRGLQAKLGEMAGLPGKIEDAKKDQLRLASEIHEEKLAQAEVYRKHYGAVQSFIDSHDLASDRLRLSFVAELSESKLAERLLGMLSQNRRGSFMGVDDGRARIDAIIAPTEWQDAASVAEFLCRVDDALHFDQRAAQPEPVLLKEQMAKGRRPEEVYDVLYSLEYVHPRYVLRWDGRDLDMLSPGERGTLLLVFYLLVDKSDIPLVIDQPEGNLDNHTVARVLVDCIKEARQRRQVFIVTHNPNLAVVCDADQVVHAHMDKADGNAITYTSGALENPAISQHVTDVLEGTRWAFGVRGLKYGVAD